MKDVVVKVKFTGEVHARFRAWVFEHGTTMQRRIVDLVEANNGRVAQEVKQDSTKSGRNPEDAAKIAGSSPVASSKPDQKTCKHYFAPGGGACLKCGWVTPMA